MKQVKCPKCEGNECVAIIEEVDIGVGTQTFLSGYECQKCGQISVCQYCGALSNKHEIWCSEKGDEMEKNGTAIIIFCNDDARLVIIGSDRDAKKKRDKLQKADKNKHVNEWRDIDAESYDRRFIWHIKNADYEVIG